MVFVMNLGHVSLWTFEVISSVEGSLFKLTRVQFFKKLLSQSLPFAVHKGEQE